MPHTSTRPTSPHCVEPGLLATLNRNALPWVVCVSRHSNVTEPVWMFMFAIRKTYRVDPFVACWSCSRLIPCRCPKSPTAQDSRAIGNLFIPYAGRTAPVCCLGGECHRRTTERQHFLLGAVPHSHSTLTLCPPIPTQAHARTHALILVPCHASPTPVRTPPN
jgi:hypothetical protein